MLLPWISRRWLCRLVVATAGVAAALAAGPGSSIARAGGNAEARRTPLVEAIERAMPAVVSITSEKRAASNSRWPFSPEESRRPRVNGMGTGVILDERGFILTNQHVVDKVEDIRVYLPDGSSYRGPGPPAGPGDGPGPAQDRRRPAPAGGRASAPPPT